MFNRGGAGRAKGFGFSGFSIAPRRTGPETQMAQVGFGAVPGMGSARSTESHYGKRRIKNEEEYFDQDEDEGSDLEYQPAPGSPSLQHDKKEDHDSGADSDDPLESFMAGLEKEIKHDKKKAIAKAEKVTKKGVRDDIDNEDDQESYYRYMEENPMAGVILEEDEMIEYDQDGNPIIPDRKVIDPLPPVDHSEIEYGPFSKNFYEEHAEIASLTPQQVVDLRNKLGIRVSGIDPAKPVSSFGHFGFDDNLIKSVLKAGYEKPTPIQAQGVPIAVGGRDIIGIAKTGSGKTAAFLWPLLVHIMDQKELEPGDGPIGLICAPTRELSQQIYQEAKKFGKIYNINVVCAYGGGSLWEQCKACDEGAEIIVATPGRLIDLVKKRATKLNRVTFLVLDEADRMFDMGFEPQVRSIANHIRPDRQTLLFSATFRKRIERLARDILRDPIRVVQGDIGEANEDVTQIVKILTPGPSKWQWLISRIVEFTSQGSVLIFVTKKTNSQELASNLLSKDFNVGLMHGDMSQTERNDVISKFKKKDMPILVATDVAARGLDIPHIKTVVNFDVARDIDTHTHRIGRTGRAGMKGTAYTLVTIRDKDFAGHLVRNLEGAGQTVSQELLDLAVQNPWFKKSRYRQQKLKRVNVGGKGLGFKERPGLGASENFASSKGDPGGGFASWQPNKSVGPQSDRVSAMKASFVSQYQHNFVTASADTAWKGSTGTTEYTNPGVEKPDYGSGSIQHASILNSGIMEQSVAQHAQTHAERMAAGPPPGYPPSQPPGFPPSQQSPLSQNYNTAAPPPQFKPQAVSPTPAVPPVPKPEVDRDSYPGYTSSSASEALDSRRKKRSRWDA